MNERMNEQMNDTSILQASCSLTGTFVDYGTNHYCGDENYGPIYIWDAAPTNDASLSQAPGAFLTLHDMAGIWIEGHVDQQASAKVALGFMSQFALNPGTSLKQETSASINLVNYNQFWADQYSALNQGPSTSIYMSLTNVFGDTCFA